MRYTIVKQVIGEVDVMPAVDIKDCITTMHDICDEMYKEGIKYTTKQVHQQRWGATLLFEVHADDGCIYSVFKNEITD